MKAMLAERGLHPAPAPPSPDSTTTPPEQQSEDTAGLDGVDEQLDSDQTDKNSYRLADNPQLAEDAQGARPKAAQDDLSEVAQDGFPDEVVNEADEAVNKADEAMNEADEAVNEADEAVNEADEAASEADEAINEVSDETPEAVNKSVAAEANKIKPATAELPHTEPTAAVAVLACCEGAVNGHACAPNGCKWERSSKTAREEEKQIYKVSAFSADTMYCHHFNRAGEHLVLHGLPSSDARHCCGVIYMSVGWGGKKLKCKEQRRPKKEGKKTGHDKCNIGNCAFLAEGLECPYMPLGCTRVETGDGVLPEVGQDSLPEVGQDAWTHPEADP